MHGFSDIGNFCLSDPAKRYRKSLTVPVILNGGLQA
jgi:hypothetical protein